MSEEFGITELHLLKDQYVFGNHKAAFVAIRLERAIESDYLLQWTPKARESGD